MPQQDDFGAFLEERRRKQSALSIFPPSAPEEDDFGAFLEERQRASRPAPTPQPRRSTAAFLPPGQRQEFNQFRPLDPDPAAALARRKEMQPVKKRRLPTSAARASAPDTARGELIPTPPRPIRRSQQSSARVREAALIARALESSKRRATDLFKQADEIERTDPGLLATSPGRRGGMARPIFDPVTRSFTRQSKVLRDRAEAELKNANSLAQEAQRRYADLLETGFGEDADPRQQALRPEQRRRWAYVKAKNQEVAEMIKPKQRNLGVLTGMIKGFKDLESEGKLEEAKGVAAYIKNRWGDLVEVGTDAGGRPTVEPKAGSGFTYQPPGNIPPAATTRQTAEDYAAQPWIERRRRNIKTGIDLAGQSLAETILRGRDVVGGAISGDFRPLKEQAEGAGRGLLKLVSAFDPAGIAYKAVAPVQDAALAELERRRAERLKNDPLTMGANVERRRLEAEVAAQPGFGGAVTRGVVSGGLQSLPYVAAGMLSGGSLPVLAGTGAAQSDFVRPEEAALNIAGAVVPVKVTRAATPYINRAAAVLPGRVTQAAGRATGQVGLGGATNVAMSLAAGERDPMKLAESGAIGGLTSLSDAARAARQGAAVRLKNIPLKESLTEAERAADPAANAFRAKPPALLEQSTTTPQIRLREAPAKPSAEQAARTQLRAVAPTAPMIIRGLAGRPRAQQDVNQRKKDITRLLPFIMQGHKSELLARGLDVVVDKAAQTSRRVIDAFAGSGTYTHYVRSKGMGHEGDILNEYDPLRHITHKQIKENPAEVGREAQRTLDAIKRLTDTIRDGEPTSEKHISIRREVTKYFQDRLAKLVVPGQRRPARFRTGEVTEMQDSPETAGLYIILQNQAFQTASIQAELGAKGFRLPVGVVVNKKGKVKKFIHNREQTFNAPRFVAEASKRFQGLDVRRGDGWELIRKEAGEGDFVPVDTSYINKVDKKTTNYNKRTQEDAIPEIYIRKVQENLLPAWERGAKILITNNWDDGVAAYLESQGFRVFKEFVQGAQKRERQELIAINFDERTGELYNFRR